MIRHIFFLLLFCGALFAGDQKPENKIKVKLNKSEKRVFFEEMVAMDVAVRNIASMLALNDYFHMKLSFIELSVYKNSESPYNKSNLNKVIGKLKAKKFSLFMENIQKESVSAIQFIDTELKPEAETNNQILVEKFEAILKNCQGCHSVMAVTD